MPAREAMSRVVVAVKPFSANASTAASSSRSRAVTMLMVASLSVDSMAQEADAKQALSHVSRRGIHMPEAVIVSTARSPIGRAFKGSLKEMRGDDLTVQ